MNPYPPDRSHLPRKPGELREASRAGEKPQSRQLPRYKVVLHADATADLMVIVRTVMELIHFCRAEATHKMWEAYHFGRSVLVSTYRERAELYVEQFASRGLVVTIEPV